MANLDTVHKNEIKCYRELENMLRSKNILLKHDEYAGIERFDSEKYGKPCITCIEFLHWKILVLDWYSLLVIPGSE